MRNREKELQFERALATAEATLSLLREQLALQEQRRQSDREWFEDQLADHKERSRGDFDRQHQLIAMVGALQDKLDAFRLSQEDLLVRLSAKLDHQSEVLAIPTRDVPTVEELLEQAKLDDSKRKLLQNTLAELEFADTEIDFN